MVPFFLSLPFPFVFFCELGSGFEEDLSRPLLHDGPLSASSSNMYVEWRRVLSRREGGGGAAQMLLW